MIQKLPQRCGNSTIDSLGENSDLSLNINAQRKISNEATTSSKDVIS